MHLPLPLKWKHFHRLSESFLSFFLSYFTVRLQCKLTSMLPGDGLDNDCDGQFDEEVFDKKDNDGDGKIDEDLELVRILPPNKKRQGWR